jgi:hypothetical protein
MDPPESFRESGGGVVMRERPERWEEAQAATVRVVTL